jgi:hypothetical protein
MRRTTSLVLLFLFGVAVAAEPVASGVSVGQRPGPYSFLVATGPQRGQQTCYICEQGDKPTVVVFARTLSDSLGKLLVKLDSEVVAQKDAGLKVWMTELAETADLDILSKWAQKQGLKNIPVGAYEDTDGPPAYKLHADADVTVLLFVKQKVISNFAFRKGDWNEKQIEEILKVTPGILAGK